jgi:hypothetical protein
LSYKQEARCLKVKNTHLNSSLLHITQDIQIQHQRVNIDSETQWHHRGTESQRSSYFHSFLFGRVKDFQSKSRKSVQRSDRVLQSEGQSTAILRDPCVNLYITHFSPLPETLQYEPDVPSSDLPSYQ